MKQKKFYILLAVFFGILLFFLAGTKKYSIHQQTYIPFTIIGATNFENNPVAQEPFGIGNIKKNSPQSLEIELPNSFKQIDSFSLYFLGNLHSTSAFSPIDFTVFFLDSNKKVLHKQVFKDYRNNKLTITNNALSDTNIIRFEISKAVGDTISLGEIKFFKLQNVSLIKYINNYVTLNNKNFLFYIVYTIIFYFYLIIPGLVVLNLFEKKYKYRDDIKYLLALIFSLLTLFLIGLLFIAFQNTIILHLYSLLFLISTPYFIYKKQYLIFFKIKKVLFIQGLVLVLLILLQAFREYLFNLNNIEYYIDTLIAYPYEGGYFGYHADNTLVWGISRVFLNKAPLYSDLADKLRIGWNGNSFFDRTPMLHILLVPILKLFGESHFIYQRFITLIVSFYYVSVLSLSISLTNRKNIAYIATYIIILSSVLTLSFNNVEIFLKLIAAIPLLIGLSIYFKNKQYKWDIFLTSFLIMVSVLFHMLNVLFLPGFAIYMLFSQKLNYKNVLKVVQITFPTIIILIIWVVIAYIFKQNETINNTHQNLYIDRILNTENKTLLSLITVRIINMVNVFIPDIKLQVIQGNKLEISYWLSYLINFMKYSFFSVITPFLFLYALFSTTKKKLVNNLWVLFLGVMPFVTYIILHNSYNRGGSILVMQISIPFLLIFTLNLITTPTTLVKWILASSVIVWNLIAYFFTSGLFTNVKYINPVLFTLFGLNILFLALTCYLFLREFIGYKFKN